MTTELDIEDLDPEIPRPPATPSRVEVACAFLGGALGTLARYGFDRAWPEPDGVAPHTTNVINALGAFVAGVLATTIALRCPERRALRALLVTGVLGGWTTMSALAVADVRLGAMNGVFTAVVASAASFGLGVGAAAAGVRLARRRFGAKDGSR